MASGPWEEFSDFRYLSPTDYHFLPLIELWRTYTENGFSQVAGDFSFSCHYQGCISKFANFKCAR